MERRRSGPVAGPLWTARPRAEGIVDRASTENRRGDPLQLLVMRLGIPCVTALLFTASAKLRHQVVGAS